MRTVYIGCSGFHYQDWRGQYYPKKLPAKKWLEYYAEEFDTVEINNTFYRLPKETTMQNWHRRTPGNFRFTLKGSRYITHLKQLNVDKDLREGLQRFYTLADELKGKLGPILWQLPGRLKRDDAKLKDFCEALNKNYHNVIEFRHKSWFDDTVYDILKEHNVTICLISAPGLPEPEVKTTDMIYIRFHGKKDWYDHLYSEEDMKDWAERLAALKPRRLFAYFNNDWHTHAITNARQLLKALKQT